MSMPWWPQPPKAIKQEETKTEVKEFTFKNTKAVLTTKEVMETIPGWKTATCKLSPNGESSLFIIEGITSWKMKRDECSKLMVLKNKKTKPVEEKPVEEKPVEKKPVEEKPAEKKIKKEVKKEVKKEIKKPAEKKIEKEVKKEVKEPAEKKIEKPAEKKVKKEVEEKVEKEVEKPTDTIMAFLNKWKTIAGINELSFIAKTNNAEDIEIIHVATQMVFPAINLDAAKLVLINLNSINLKWESRSEKAPNKFSTFCAKAIAHAHTITGIPKKEETLDDLNENSTEGIKEEIKKKEKQDKKEKEKKDKKKSNKFGFIETKPPYLVAKEIETGTFHKDLIKKLETLGIAKNKTESKVKNAIRKLGKKGFTVKVSGLKSNRHYSF